MGMSQMCKGAGDYFRTSKPHSEKLCCVMCKVLFCNIIFKRKVIYKNTCGNCGYMANVE